MKKEINDIIEKLEIIKSELYEITNKISDYKESSYFSFSVDKVNGLIEHLLIFENRFDKN